MSRERRIAWAARLWASASHTAMQFRDAGNISAARSWGARARQDWADLQRLLGVESANVEAKP